MTRNTKDTAQHREAIQARPLEVVQPSPSDPVPVRPMTPLQAEVLEAGLVPEPDGIGAGLLRPDLAPEAGYYENGPVESAGPDIVPDDVYEGCLPVFQWQVDPADPSLQSGEVSLAHGNWEYSIWWQVHPVGLVYASIQALEGDEVRGTGRRHPIGRNVVVNLVYDQKRKGVVAIYGTARDFRPFVEVFRLGFGLEESAKENKS